MPLPDKFLGCREPVISPVEQIKNPKLGGSPFCQVLTAKVTSALACGFEVILLEDASRGVDVKPGDSEKAVAEMKEKGVGVGRTEELE